MRTLQSIVTAGFVLAASGCSSLEVLQFTPDEKYSGFVKGQRVSVAYVMPKSDQSVCNDPDNCFNFGTAGIPDAVKTLCTEPRVAAAVPALAMPFIVAAGQIAFDVIVGAIDSRREKLKNAAVKRYDSSAIAPNLILGFGGPDVPECVIVERFVGEPEKRAMTLVNYLKHHASDSSPPVKGLTWTTAYLRVDLAAAQTAEVKDGKSKINLTETLSVGAIQPDPKTNVDAVELVSTTTFAFKGVELGVPYINATLVGKPASLPKGWKALTAPDGPLFVGLRKAPTVGAVSAAVVEQGSAAALEDVSPVEKSIRDSIRTAIGSSLETRFSE